MKRKTGKRWSEIDMSGSVKTIPRISGRINRKGYGILILWIGCRGGMEQVETVQAMQEFIAGHFSE